MTLLTSIYGVFCYLAFLGTFVYAVGFLGNMVVPKTINDGVATGTMTAALINVGLVSVFALQHTIMARPAFKAVWTRIVPKAAERSTYVLFSSLALILLFWQWRPMPEVIWSLDGAAASTVRGVQYLGWAILLVSSFTIDHFSLFGLRQVWDHMQSKVPPPSRFVAVGLYKLCRHPLMLGFLIAFWSTPHMTYGHLVFALANTAYIAMGLQFEERALVRELGEEYRAYQRQVPMVLPFPRKRVG